MPEYRMLIDGKLVPAVSGKTMPVINPATGEEVAQIPLGGHEDVDKAVAAAKKAFPVWSRKPINERSMILNQIAAMLKEYSAELGELEVIDHGSMARGKGFLGLGSAQYFEWVANAIQHLNGDLLTVDPRKKIILQYEPIGVSALITPWNAPLIAVVEKLSFSLAVGNTCVVKPPSVDSLSTLKFGELLNEMSNVLPAGVVNIVTGPGSTVGEALAAHPDVGLIAFTGSCETGKRLVELGSRTMKRVQMELGGKNPVIVLDDADLDRAAAVNVFAQCANSGQICASPGRFYIHNKVYDRFLEKFVAGMKNIVVGDPNDDKTQMGPMASEDQRDRVEDYIKKGIEEGAKLVLGGKRPTQPPLNKGYYVMPTVFTGVTQNMTIAREEIFGPVACIMEPFSSDEEVIEKANDNTYGLVSYVWTKDSARGLKFADRLQAGTVNINNEGGPHPGVPWGGFKESGIGKDHSRYGLEDYAQMKAISIDVTGGNAPGPGPR
jgi:acyl-CoA reductase-like NAD-dependent aldehyde dehydrogenase